MAGSVLQPSARVRQSGGVKPETGAPAGEGGLAGPTRTIANGRSDTYDDLKSGSWTGRAAETVVSVCGGVAAKLIAFIRLPAASRNFFWGGFNPK